MSASRRAAAEVGRCKSAWSSYALVYSDDGRWIASGDRRQVYLWRASDGALERTHLLWDIRAGA